MWGECHAHIFMDGVDYKGAAARYASGPDEADIRRKLQSYQGAGITFVRDGGDHYGAGKLAKALAPEYDIDYRTPVFAIHRTSCYGSIVGRGFATMKEYAALVAEAKEQGADYIKVMLSGIMDFAGDGGVTGTPLDRETIFEMVHIAHEEGMAVMAHVNGAKPILDAIEAGTDSIEHGNFMDEDCILALCESAGTEQTVAEGRPAAENRLVAEGGPVAESRPAAENRLVAESDPAAENNLAAESKRAAAGDKMLQAEDRVSAATIWVPTHVTIRNLLRSRRFDHTVIQKLMKQQSAAIRAAYEGGACIALGSDAGAFGVGHASGIADEYEAIREITGVAEEQLNCRLAAAELQIRTRFRLQG